MRRRTFLRSLAEVLGLAALPAQALPQVSSRAIVLQNSSVAGFQHHDGESVWPLLRVGDDLQLVREAHNPFDAKAVRIEWESYKLGYVPRIENHAIAQLIDRGEVLAVRIAELNDSSDPWQRVGVEVSLITRTSLST